jgi:hypothetical protein
MIGKDVDENIKLVDQLSRLTLACMRSHGAATMTYMELIQSAINFQSDKLGWCEPL